MTEYGLRNETTVCDIFLFRDDSITLQCHRVSLGCKDDSLCSLDCFAAWCPFGPVTSHQALDPLPRSTSRGYP